MTGVLKPATLEIEDLNVWFELGRNGGRSYETHVVKNLNLSLGAGERLGLVGESGSGKTTTILAAMGLLPPSARVSGSVRLNGTDILANGDRSVAPHRWKDIAMVFQGAMNAFNPVKTVGWQIAEAMAVHGVARGRAARVQVGELLELVGIPPDHATRFPHEFSGGMRQRAIIAMALSCRPKVLLADEPTTALDVMVQDQVLKLLARLTEELGLALILVTHDLGVVAETCHRAAVMLGGEVVEHGELRALYHDPKHEYTARLFRATPSLDGNLRGASADSKDRPPEAPLLRIRDLRVDYAVPRSLGDIMLRRASRPKPAVRGISLEIAPGEMVALVGQSGCGKTTTVQTILGMIRNSGGSIMLNGTEVTGLGIQQWHPLRRRVQMIYQDPYESLDIRFRVRDTVTEPLRIHGIGRNLEEREALAVQAMERVGLTPAGLYLDRYPHELSGGQRQRVAIAASIVLEPELLLADEPVSMLDVSVRTGILELLSQLRRDARMGILMITHDLSTAANYADRIAVMHEGLIVEEGTAEDVIRRPQASYTRALLASIPNPDPEARRSGAAA